MPERSALYRRYRPQTFAAIVGPLLFAFGIAPRLGLWWSIAAIGCLLVAGGEAAAIALELTMTGTWNSFLKLALPILAVAALAITGGAAAFLLIPAILGLALLGAAPDAAVERLSTIPGISQLSAQVIVSEIGTDMSRFATDAPLRSWAGLCPRNDESAGKRRSTRLRKGAPWLKAMLIQCAWAAARSKGNLPACPVRPIA